MLRFRYEIQTPKSNPGNPTQWNVEFVPGWILTPKSELPFYNQAGVESCFYARAKFGVSYATTVLAMTSLMYHVLDL